MTFTSPVKALEYLQDHPVDLIISDFRMPEMNGATFLTEAGSCKPIRRASSSAPTRYRRHHACDQRRRHFPVRQQAVVRSRAEGAIVQVLAHRALQVENQQTRQRGSPAARHHLGAAGGARTSRAEAPGITSVRWAEDGSVLVED
jgi:CheY-like chemotaxis protein